MRRLILIMLLMPLCAVAQVALLPDRTNSSIAELQVGVICSPPSTGEAIAPGTVAGTTHLIADNPPFIARTNRVPAVLGVGFGVKSMTSDSAGLTDVTFTITHPPMGPQSATSQSFNTSISGTGLSLTFYQFDFDYELLPGFWQMAASKDGALLFRTTFEILAPQAMPELAQVCGFEELLS